VLQCWNVIRRSICQNKSVTVILCLYEGHPINKVLNGIILLIVKTWKIWDIRFVGNLFQHKCCELHYDDVTVTVTSVINIKYGDVTIESILQGNCHTVIPFLWAIGFSTNAIHSEMRTVYSNKCFTRPVIHFGVKSLLRVKKVLLGRNDLAAVLFWRPMQLIISSWVMSLMRETLKWIWKICWKTVWHIKMSACRTCSFFS